MSRRKMSEEAKAARAEYMREYRQRPEVKERQKEYNRRHWEKRAAENQYRKEA